MGYVIDFIFSVALEDKGCVWTIDDFLFQFDGEWVAVDFVSSIDVSDLDSLRDWKCIFSTSLFPPE